MGDSHTRRNSIESTDGQKTSITAKGITDTNQNIAKWLASSGDDNRKFYRIKEIIEMFSAWHETLASLDGIPNAGLSDFATYIVKLFARQYGHETFPHRNGQACLRILDTKAAGGTKFQVAVLLDQLLSAHKVLQDHTTQASESCSLEIPIKQLSSAITSGRKWVSPFIFADPFLKKNRTMISRDEAETQCNTTLQTDDVLVLSSLVRRHAKLFVTFCKAPFVEFDIDLYERMTAKMKHNIKVYLATRKTKKDGAAPVIATTTREDSSSSDPLFSLEQLAVIFESLESNVQDPDLQGILLSVFHADFVAKDLDVSSKHDAVAVNLCKIAHGLSQLFLTGSIQQGASPCSSELVEAMNYIWRALFPVVDKLNPNYRLMLMNALARCKSLMSDADYVNVVDTYFLRHLDYEVSSLGRL